MNKRIRRALAAVLVVYMILTLVPLHATSVNYENDSLSDELMTEDETATDSNASIENGDNSYFGPLSETESSTISEDILEETENDNLPADSVSLEDEEQSAEQEVFVTSSDDEAEESEKNEFLTPPPIIEDDAILGEEENINEISLLSLNNPTDFYEEYINYELTSTYISAINSWGNAKGPNLYYGNGTETVKQISQRVSPKVREDGREKDADISPYSTNEYMWCYHTNKYNDCYVLESVGNGKYIVTEVIFGDATLENYTIQWADKVPPKDGLILFSDIINNNSYSEKLRNLLIVGTEVSLTFNPSDYIYSLAADTPVGKLEFCEEPVPNKKEERNNNIQTIDYASTLGKVNIELFNYDENINERWNIDNEYPGFNNANKNPGHITSGNGWTWGNLGDIITKDIKGSDNNVTNKGAINKASGNIPFLVNNEAVLDNRLENGYPKMKNGTNLDYLFKEGNGVTKASKEGLDGLFQYDPETYTYYFNSRENIAIYNEDTNMFELYDGMITPNYSTYVFGNFLPFQNVQSAKRVSEIDRAYLVDLFESTVYKLNHETDADMKIQYAALANWLQTYIKVADSKFGSKNWTYLDTMNDVFKTLGFHKNPSGQFVPLTEKDLDFSKLYNIDFDDEKDFWFGMSQEVNFYQPEGGMVGRNNAYEMVYKFTGDDDFWLYIDGDLFIDLTGLHRHHGAEINFTKGTVSYYQTDVNNDGDLIEEPVLVQTFSELVSDQSKLNSKGTFKDVSEFMNENRTDYIDGYDEASAMAACSHNLKLFYMERGSGSGVCRMNFNFPIIETHFNDANINLNIEKEINAKDEDFDRLALDKEQEYNFEITLKELKIVGNKEMLSGKIITGTVSNKKGLTIKSLPAGKYIISESESLYFDFLDFKSFDNTGAITLTKQDNRYILEIDSNKIIPDGTYYMKVINTTEDERFYDSKYNVKNLFTPIL